MLDFAAMKTHAGSLFKNMLDPTPSLDGESDTSGFVQGFLVFFFWIRICDDASADLIDKLISISNNRADGDVE